MDMAISANSRMRECGTASAEAAITGANLVCGLDTFEDRRCGNAESGENGGGGKGLAIGEDFRNACPVINPNFAFFGIYGPNRFAAMRKIESNFLFETRRGL